MPLNDLTANHIGQASGGFEPQRPNNNVLFIDGLGTEDREVLRLSLASFPLPKVNIGVIEVNYLNERRKFPGLPTWDDLTFIFYDFVDRDTAAALWRWYREGYDPATGKVGLARQYKKTGRIVQYSPEGSMEREYELQGMWISGMDPGEADYASEDVLRINATFCIDKAISTFDNFRSPYA